MKIETLEARRAAAGLDVNNDGTVDTNDVEQMCSAVQAEQSYGFGTPWEWKSNREKGYDLNGDERINGQDVAEVIHSLGGAGLGDMNYDGVIDVQDLDTLWASDRGRYLFDAVALIDDQSNGGAYADGNLTCQGEGVSVLRGSRFGVDHVYATEFGRRDGDVNADGKFDSSDFVYLLQHEGAANLETSEIVRIFQIGAYEQE